MAAGFTLIWVAGLIALVRTQVLSAPWQNLARSATIVASATCGDVGTEKICSVKAVTSTRYQEVCSQCGPNSPYSANNTIDDLESTFWRSPTLARGTQYNQVTLTLDLGEECSVGYVKISMGDSPRPKVWALERSDNNGETWKPWQYFADSTRECQEHFGTTVTTITEDDTVICSTNFSAMEPRTGGEMLVSLLEGRPSASNFVSLPKLQEWTRATQIRIRLLRLHIVTNDQVTKNEPDRYFPFKTFFQNQDLGTRSFYAIKDISVRGVKRESYPPCNCQ